MLLGSGSGLAQDSLLALGPSPSPFGPLPCVLLARQAGTLTGDRLDANRCVAGGQPDGVLASFVAPQAAQRCMIGGRVVPPHAGSRIPTLKESFADPLINFRI